MDNLFCTENKLDDLFSVDMPMPPSLFQVMNFPYCRGCEPITCSYALSVCPSRSGVESHMNDWATNLSEACLGIQVGGNQNNCVPDHAHRRLACARLSRCRAVDMVALGAQISRHAYHRSVRKYIRRGKAGRGNWGRRGRWGRLVENIIQIFSRIFHPSFPTALPNISIL